MKSIKQINVLQLQRKFHRLGGKSKRTRKHYLIVCILIGLCMTLFTAGCDEGEESPVGPPVTGTISGVITVEGEAIPGVSVELSNGMTTTTDASGNYSFTEVPAGAYTVSISGGPLDATFSSTSKAATISSTGQVLTVNFDGVYIRTSEILGTVTIDEQRVEDVIVSLNQSSSAETDADGYYSFTGIRAGTYELGLTEGVPQNVTFDPLSIILDVDVGETVRADFAGTTNTLPVSISVSPETLSAEHIVGDSPCPQDVGSFTLTNNGGVTVTWGAAAQSGALDIDTSEGTLNPGESITINVEFNCATSSSFTSSVLIQAQGDGTQVEAEVAVSMSIP